VLCVHRPVFEVSYAKMNQPYRIRIKTKVKVRFALFIITLALALYFLLKIDFGIKPDVVKYGQSYLLEAVEIMPGGSYRGSRFNAVGKFKLSSDKYIHSTIYVISHDGFYCVAEVLVNGEVKSYQTIKYDNCV